MRVRRAWMTWSQRNELWRRWQRGESLPAIARALERGLGRIYTIVTAEGGIAPVPRRRSRLALTTGSERKSHVDSPKGRPCAASPAASAERRRR